VKHCADWHLPEKLQKALVDDKMLARLQDYERPRFVEWLTKRFKKTTPTVLECLTMGKRYPSDSHLVERAVARMHNEEAE